MKKDLVFNFGNRHDGVIGVPCLTDDGHVVEASYFFGDQKPKNIICISSQVGCLMSCAFCEIGSKGFVRNLTWQEMCEEVSMVLDESRKLGFSLGNMPHKITIANGGELLLNEDIVGAVENLACLFGTSFKLCTIMPKSKVAQDRFAKLAEFASGYGHPVQLQISLLSTSESEREKISGGGAAGFASLRRMAELWRSKNPKGRKVNLSLLITEHSALKAGDVTDLFPSELFRFRFREYVPTANGRNHELTPVSSETLLKIKADFKAKGYEVDDAASPTPTERRFGLVANAIRRMYMDIVQ